MYYRKYFDKMNSIISKNIINDNPSKSHLSLKSSKPPPKLQYVYAVFFYIYFLSFAYLIFFLLDLAISGGKETYKDSSSNGERTGKCPAWESGACSVWIVVWRSVLSGGPGPSPLERGAGEGESLVVAGPCRTTRSIKL